MMDVRYGILIDTLVCEASRSAAECLENEMRDAKRKRKVPRIVLRFRSKVQVLVYHFQPISVILTVN